MEPELLRALARYAGCHIVCDTDDFVFMNASYLSVHAASSGMKRLSLPRASSVVELYTGSNYGEETREIVVPMEAGATVTFRLS